VKTMNKFCRVLQLKELTKKDEGQALLLTSVALMVLLAMAGVGVDVGYLKYQRHQMQKAADAGALAAAMVMTRSANDTLIRKAALYDVAANGFTDGTTNISVTVNHPPQSGPFSGNNAYVEVYVAQPRPNFFLKVLGFNTTNVRARAVGSSKGDASGCIYAMDPHSAKTFLVDGNVGVNTTCGIQVNSDNSDALHENGVSGSVDATGSGNGIGVVGGYSGANFIPTPVTGIARVTDPFAGLAAPDTSGACKVYNGETTITSGKYCGGIRISSSGTYTFTGGMYILYGGGLTVTGSAQLLGTGVTFYNTGTTNGPFQYAPITLAGSSTSNLSAPTDPAAPYAGILFFQDRNYRSTKNTDQSSVNGSNGAVFVGAMYFLNTDLKYAGTPGLAASTVIVAWQIEFNGTTTINNDFLNGGSPLKTASLAE
jgi:hypothetical protein